VKRVYTTEAQFTQKYLADIFWTFYIGSKLYFTELGGRLEESRDANLSMRVVDHAQHLLRLEPPVLVSKKLAEVEQALAFCEELGEDAPENHIQVFE
jgi:hypothetical protein